MTKSVFLKQACLILGVILGPQIAGAQPSSTTPATQDEALLALAELMQTDIALKTDWLGADDSPGLVTVLSNKDMSARGVRTVREALNLIPGLHMSISSSGGVTPIVRGVGGHLLDISGKIKLLVNGVSYNSTLTATGGGFYDIPIEQLERVEVIRGPGSAVYGEYAYSGVINLVTRKDVNSAFIRYGSFDQITGGVQLNHTADNGLYLSLNLSGWRQGDVEITAGEDSLYNLGLGFLSNAPGPSNENAQDITAIFSLEYQGYQLLIQHFDQQHGDYFGINNILPPESDRRIFTNRISQVEARKDMSLKDDLLLELKLGYRNLTNIVDDIVALPPGLNPALPSGVISTYVRENEYYAGTDFTWSGIQDHRILLGLEFSHTELDEVSLSTPLQHDKERRLFSLVLQDHFQLSKNISLTAGGRYDNYDDVNNSFTPRIAGVYQINDHHLVKAQYAEAFRPPTFGELYGTIQGSEDIDPETTNSTELAYIYRNNGSIFRFTLFHTKLQNLITVNKRFPGDLGIFQNTGNAKLQGGEFEWDKQFSSSIRFNGNISYVDAVSEETDEKLEGSSDWLANAGLIYQPANDYTLNLQYCYVGDRNRASFDSREELDAYHTFDATGSIFNLGLTGFSLRGGIKNLFDEDVVESSPPGSYAEDYPREGRSYWVQAAIDF